MSGNEFEVRDLTIAHESVWENLTVWARDHGLQFVRFSDGDEEHLPSYLITTIFHLCNRCGKEIEKRGTRWYAVRDTELHDNGSGKPVWHAGTCPEGTIEDSRHLPATEE